MRVFLGMVFQIITAAIAVVVCINVWVAAAGRKTSSGLLLLPAKAAAFLEFIYFLVVITTGIINAMCLASVSNHAILTLDILYLISLLLLICFHAFKEPDSYPATVL